MLDGVCDLPLLVARVVGSDANTTLPIGDPELDESLDNTNVHMTSVSQRVNSLLAGRSEYAVCGMCLAWTRVLKQGPQADPTACCRTRRRGGRDGHHFNSNNSSALDYGFHRRTCPSSPVVTTMFWCG